jgi:hypothetical protein
MGLAAVLLLSERRTFSFETPGADN